MNQHVLSGPGDASVAEPDYERIDMRRRDVVNHAISVQESSNTMAAIEYLKSHDIDAQVIERVLLEPQRRRRPTHH
jgi:hypothetical protein